MHIKFKLTLTCFLLTFLFSWLPSQAQDSQKAAETVVHLLSYVSMDYGEAIQDGKIIDDQEYAEQQEFSEQALKLVNESDFLNQKDKEKVISQIDNLRQLIDKKGTGDRISELAGQINSTIISATNIITAPKVWPTIENGASLFAQNCALCHGKTGRGDGLAGQGLEPSPSNFHEIALMENFSPYQAYNSIRLGVPGTAMQAYSELNEVEIWDLAFYVKSLRFKDASIDSLKLRNEFVKITDKVDLKTIATYTDNELRDTLSHYSDHPDLAVRAVRLLEPLSTEKLNSLPIAKKGLEAALDSYKEGDVSLAKTQAINAYLEGIEPVEARLRVNHLQFVTELEGKMFKVRQVIDKNGSVGELETRVEEAMEAIEEAEGLIKGHQLNYFLTFLIAATIMLREGLEAFLILAVVLALIRSTGARRALPWLHGGWITAVAFGVLGWFMSDYIIRFGGKNREIMEGLVSLFAVAVLVYMGFWLHNNSNGKKWASFIKEKVGGYLKENRMWGLAAFSFVIVFREAFEVILFLQAVNLEAENENKSAIGLGVLAAVVVIALIAYLILKYAKHIPLRQLFRFSSWIIVLLAVILMGKGVHSLQESGWVGVSSLSNSIHVEWLGIYPSLQAIGGQILLIAVLVIIYWYNQRRLAAHG